MAGVAMTPCGDFRECHCADTTIFPTRASRGLAIGGIALLCLVPPTGDRYVLSLMIQAGSLGIAALGLNIPGGFTGQISIGHAAFFGVGAFASAWAVEHGVPVALAMPLAGLMTTAVGLLLRPLPLRCAARDDQLGGGGLAGEGRAGQAALYVHMGANHPDPNSSKTAGEATGMANARAISQGGATPQTEYRPVHHLAGICSAMIMVEAMETAAANGGAITGERIRDGFQARRDWVPAGFEGVCNPSNFTREDHRRQMTVPLYRAVVAGDTTQGSVAELMRAGTMRLDRVTDITLERRQDWLGW